MISVTFYSFSKSFYPKSKEIRNTTRDFSLGNNMRRASNAAPSLSRIVQAKRRRDGMCFLIMNLFLRSQLDAVKFSREMGLGRSFNQ